MNSQSKEETEIIQPDGIGSLEIVPFGTDERIKLTIKIVRNLIAQPTKSGKLPDDGQCVKFMMLCKAKHLNPFEGDAYFLGYDAHNGPQFSQITAHQVFLKRAEASKSFKGLLSGVIFQNKEGGVEEREGDFMFKGETLLGGWAKVFKKELDHPLYKRLKLETFSSGQSRWLKDPAGMIVKCAEADAMRTAFPTHLGGLYIREEEAAIDIAAENIKIERPKIKKSLVQKIRDGEKGDVIPIPILEGGSETTSDEGAVPSEGLGMQTPEPTPTSNEAGSVAPPIPKKKPSSSPTPQQSSPSTPKRQLIKKSSPSVEEPVVMGPLEQQMFDKLKELGKTPTQLVIVAKMFDSLTVGQGWEDIGEEGFGILLHPDNWKLVEPELLRL